MVVQETWTTRPRMLDYQKEQKKRKKRQSKKNVVTVQKKYIKNGLDNRFLCIIKRICSLKKKVKK